MKNTKTNWVIKKNQLLDYLIKKQNYLHENIVDANCYARKFIVKAGTSHSSAEAPDVINVDIDANETVYLMWNQDHNATGSQSLVSFDSDGTRVDYCGIVNKIVEYTPSRAVTLLGLYSANNGTEATDISCEFAVIKKTQVIGAIFDLLKTKVDYDSLSYLSHFVVKANTSHSSNDDRVYVNIKSGEIVYIVWLQTGDTSSRGLAAYAPDGTSLGYLALETYKNNIAKYTATAEVGSLGLYMSNQDASAVDITCTIGVIKSTQIIYPIWDNLSSLLSNIFLCRGLKNTANDIDSKAATFNDYFIDASETESFLFFTDPHTTCENVTDEDMRKGMNDIEYAFNRTATTYCICGGDWLVNHDTKAIALNRLGYIDGFMREKYGDNYLPILGNHDTNYQGIDQEGSASNTGELTQGALQQIWFRKYGSKCYYTVKAINSRFYIFDTGTDWVASMIDYRWEQVDWFARDLIEHDDKHAIMFFHIFTNATKAELEADVAGSAVPFAQNLFEVAQKYNAKTTLTLNGETYDFSGTSGKVAFAQCGHSHYDSVVTYKDIPTVLTINATKNSNFDLCYVDYVAGKYKMARVGSGSDREVNIIT